MITGESAERGCSIGSTSATGMDIGSSGSISGGQVLQGEEQGGR